MEAKLIKEVKITGLFHKYKMEWNLNPDVNILVGINGIGKSTILRSINALLSKNEKYLKKAEIDVEVSLYGNTELAYYGIANLTKNSEIQINHEYITTFDVPLKDKKKINQTETPLDKELQSVIYTIGKKDQKSFSNYRFKTTNYPKLAKKINERINKLYDLINNLFDGTNKKIEIDKSNNSIIFLKDKSPISLEKLSSGEKQLLIILFTVFLMEEEPSILLMDEPEISLHIEWQQQLIDVIRQLNPNCQLIIATHSPSIFGEGWGDKIFFTEDLLLLP